MSGGFGLSGNPESLIPEIKASGVKDLTIISNNAGADGFGLWHLLETPPGPQDDLVLRRREQIVRAAISRRRAGARVQPAGHARREDQGRRRGHSGFLHARPASARSSPRASRRRSSTASSTCARPGSGPTSRIIKAWRADTAGQPPVPQDGAQLQPGHGHRRQGDGRRSRGAGRGGRNRSRLRPHARHLRAARSSRARSTRSASRSAPCGRAETA